MKNDITHIQCVLLPWKLEKIIIKRVYFDEELWNSLVPQIESFWKEVIDTRNNGIDIFQKKHKNKNTSTNASTNASNTKKIESSKYAQFIDSDDEEM